MEEALRTIGFDRVAVMRPSFLVGDRQRETSGRKDRNCDCPSHLVL